MAEEHILTETEYEARLEAYRHRNALAERVIEVLDRIVSGHPDLRTEMDTALTIGGTFSDLNTTPFTIPLPETHEVLNFRCNGKEFDIRVYPDTNNHEAPLWERIPHERRLGGKKATDLIEILLAGGPGAAITKTMILNKDFVRYSADLPRLRYEDDTVFEEHVNTNREQRIADILNTYPLNSEERKNKLERLNETIPESSRGPVFDTPEVEKKAEELIEFLESIITYPVSADPHSVTVSDGVSVKR